ncbi:MAG: right-handed parallel beta-helix repeat-containing protein, partial [Desulfamplus sp.]|nr:right-handed parallel beta-helix repeat-containing protein [Desulfamplus sp.]
MNSGGQVTSIGENFRNSGGEVTSAGAEFRNPGGEVTSAGAEFRNPGGEVTSAGAEFTVVDDNYIKTFYVDNKSSVTLLSQTWDISTTEKVYFKFLREKPGEAVPDNPVDTCEIIIPEGEVITVGSGISVELGSAFSMTVIGSLHVKGSENSNVDIKAGQGIHFRTSSMASVLEHCNITEGNSNSGGAISVDGFSNLTIDSCTITGNRALYGGGIFLTNGSDITINNTVISHNQGTIYGGGIYCLNSSPVLGGNVISNNGDARFGGGIYLSGSHPRIRNTWIVNNGAKYGGGIYMLNSNPLLTNSIIASNLATVSGGGMHMENSMATISSAVIAYNLGHGEGGGLYLEKSSPTMVNTILYGNAISPAGDTNIFHNQIHLDPDSLPKITHCNIMGAGEEIMGPGAQAFIAGYPPTNINVDPLFQDPPSMPGPHGNGDLSDWHLLPDSPCINAGTHDAQFESMDLDGNPRPYNERMRDSHPYHEIFTDIGAYEFQNNPPFIGENRDHVILGIKEITARDQLLMEDLPESFDVDGDRVNLVFYNPSRVSSRNLSSRNQTGASSYSPSFYAPAPSSDHAVSSWSDPASTSSYSTSESVPTGTFYQVVTGDDGPQRGEMISHMDPVKDPERRIIYVPPSGNGSFSATFTFKAHDGISLSTNSVFVTVSVDA